MRVVSAAPGPLNGCRFVRAVLLRMPAKSRFALHKNRERGLKRPDPPMFEKVRGKSNRGGRRQGAGRKPGIPNKISGELKEAILQAAKDAGDGDIAAYLKDQAIKNPAPFMSLLGKVLPMQVTGEGGGALQIEVVKRIYDVPTH